MIPVHIHAVFDPTMTAFVVTVTVPNPQQTFRSTMDYKGFKKFVQEFGNDAEIGGFKFHISGQSEEYINKMREYLFKVLNGYEAFMHMEQTEE